MTRAVVVAFHNYTYTLDHRYYEPIFNFFMRNFREAWYSEADELYLVDSNWGCKYIDPKVKILEVPQHLRYYDVYKRVLPKIKEDLVLFMDNDMVVYRKGIVDTTFKKLEEGYHVVSILDTIGKTFLQLGGKSKFCPYWFATHKKLLMEFTNIEWGPEMPEYETLGRLTEEMLKAGVKFFEVEEDKTDEGKNLGYYHIRAGSVPAYLLTTKHFGDPRTYWEYIRNQPASEVLRQCGWYDRMGGDTSEIRKDISESSIIFI